MNADRTRLRVSRFNIKYAKQRVLQQLPLPDKCLNENNSLPDPRTIHLPSHDAPVKTLAKIHPTEQLLTPRTSRLMSSKSLTIFVYIIAVVSNIPSVRTTTSNPNINAKECIEQVIIDPMVINNSKTSPLSSGFNCDTKLQISFTAFGERFVINLVKNERLISERYFKFSDDRHADDLNTARSKGNDDFNRNHLFLNLNDIKSNQDHCHYLNSLEENNGNHNIVSAISIVNGRLLSGYFHDNSHTYHLKADTTGQQTILSRESKDCSANLQQEKLRFQRDTKNQRSTPDNHINHGPFQANSSSLYVELLIVHDHSQYVEYKKDAANIAERTMQIVNIMNAFYRQLNIFIALVGVVLWTEKDEITLSDDGDATLTNFLKYRYEKLLPKFHHDNAQLITSTSFNGSVVGKALKGPICTHEHSGGVNTDHSHSPAIVAVTLAHELGHNFGMEHDEDENCRCPDEKCIMSSSSSLVHPKHWSSCSIAHLEDSRKQGLLDCLSDIPEKVFGPICGNGFIEEGEDCDLGELIPSDGSSRSRKSNPRCARGSQDCDIGPVNPCCDRHTCKFIGNATCAQGPCCDLSKCSVYNGTEPKICRGRKNECDFEEICDGHSEFCPLDVHYHDGIECGPTSSELGLPMIIGSTNHNRSRAYCFEGRCASHESQCQLLWGPTGYSSNEICYEQNIHGNTSGNCGYDRKDKHFDGCEPTDAICGMLHCVHNQPGVNDFRKTGKLRYGFESASILTVSFFVSQHSKIFCHGAIIDAGPGVRDPGMVPNGASCGEDRMCLNQKCVPVYDVVYSSNWCPSDCNGNGICDNTGVCHCNDGTIGTSCYQFFGPNFHLSLLLYIVTFFIPMIALIVFTVNHYRGQIKMWWFLHNRKLALRNKGREPNNQRRQMVYEADGHRVNISEPIPLNQHDNTNRPFYDPTTHDPWAETSSDGMKSPGYRLEPLSSANQSQSTFFRADLQQPQAISNNSMRPVRAAPPPPPPPDHTFK